MLCKLLNIFRLAVASTLLFTGVSASWDLLVNPNRSTTLEPPNSKVPALLPKSYRNSSTKIRRSHYAERPVGNNVDRITGVEVEPTQFVITTTKQGPVESLRIRIELVDLNDNRTLPPIELFGIFLVVARGRYTVPFLKPDKWYGLTFTSENELNREVNIHRENRLLRTASRHQNQTALVHLYEVTMHRDLDGEESAERLYVTARWRGQERIPHGELHVPVNVQCDPSSTTEHIVLHSNEDAVTIEITVDLLYEIENLNDTLHQVMAHIIPLKCHKVCWESSVIVHFSGNEFTAGSSNECHKIEPTNSITYLRHLKQYKVKSHGSGHELVIDTELNDEDEEGFVTLTAENLARNSSERKTKTFRTAPSNGIFHLPLSSDAAYAVRYQYTKMKPFHYTTEEHFLIDTASPNSSDGLVVPRFYTDNSSHAHINTPMVALERGDSYSDLEVQLHLGPYCDTTDSETWTLTGAEATHTVDLSDAICSRNPRTSYCDATANYTKCSPVLCYSTSVVVDADDYTSEVSCLNVSRHFPIVESSSRSSAFLLTLLLFTVALPRA